MGKNWQDVYSWPIERLVPPGKGFSFRLRNMGIKTGRELSEQTEKSLRLVRKGAHYFGDRSVALIQAHLEVIGLPRLPEGDEEKYLLSRDARYLYRE